MDKKDYINTFSNRNKTVYCLFGTLCILSGFVPFFSATDSFEIISIKGMFVFNNFNSLINLTNEIDALSRIIVSILVFFPLYIMFLGAYYLFRGILITYDGEKSNAVIYNGIRKFTNSMLGIWLTSLAGILGLFGRKNDSSDITLYLSSFKLGFYIYVGAELFRWIFQIDLPSENGLTYSSDTEGNNENTLEANDSIFPKNANETIKYYLHNGTEAEGPYSIKELGEKMKLNKGNYVWKEGMNDWEPAEDILELKDFFLTVPPPFMGGTITPPAFKRQTATPPPLKK